MKLSVAVLGSALVVLTTSACAPVMSDPVAPSAASPRSLVAQGAGLAEEYCGTCHAVGRTGESKVAGAPAFRTLSARYPIDNLAESFAEGLQVGHDGMPEFRFEPNEVRAMLAYLDSIQPAR